MIKYIELMQSVVDHIETQIHNPISLKSTSKVFHFSEYHFDRMFKAIVGTSFKKVCTGKKTKYGSG